MAHRHGFPKKTKAAFEIDDLKIFEFLNLVGETAFEEFWEESGLLSATYPVQRAASLSQDMVNFVVEQTIGALTRGLVVAYIRDNSFTYALNEKEASIYSTLYKTPNCNVEDSSELELDDFPEFDFDDGMEEHTFNLSHWKSGYFQIESRFWFEASSITTEALTQSKISIPARFITTKNSSASLESAITGNATIAEIGLAKPDDCFLVDVRVYAAEIAIRNMFRISTLPATTWFHRYKNYHNRIHDELVAFGWRYIAINKLEDKHGVGEKILRAMREYIESQGLNDTSRGMSDSTLYNLTAKILRQWRIMDAKSCVLLNSTPFKPKT